MVKSLPVLTLLLLLFIPSRGDDAPAPAPAPPVIKGKVLAPTNDVGIGNDGKALDENGYQVRIGEFHAPGGEAYLMPICLPKLPDGQQFAKVHIRAQLVGINNDGGTLANADLWGLGLRDNAKLLPTDYFQGKHDSKATLLQADFLTPTSKVRTDPNTGPFVETSADGDDALTRYFNDSYAKGANAGKYLFLRVSYDIDAIPDGNSAYSLLTSGANGDNEPPIITYTTEPAKN